MTPEDILALEAKRIRAMVERDLTTLDSLLAPELSYTHSGGRIDTKASLLQLIGEPETSYVGVDYENADVTLSGDTAVVRGLAQIRLRHMDEEHSYPVWFLDVYVQREGGWQMLAWQATRAPQ